MTRKIERRPHAEPGPGPRRANHVVWITLGMLLLMGGAPLFAAGGLQGTLEGTLTLVWGDGRPGEPALEEPVPWLTDASGASVELRISRDLAREAGGLLELNGRWVTVEGSWLTAPAATGATGVAAGASSGRIRFVEATQVVIAPRLA